MHRRFSVVRACIQFRFVIDNSHFADDGVPSPLSGEDIAKETAKEWKGLRVTVKLTVQNRVAKVSVIPSAAALVIKALKEPIRDRKKVSTRQQYPPPPAPQRSAASERRAQPHVPGMCQQARKEPKMPPPLTLPRSVLRSAWPMRGEGGDEGGWTPTPPSRQGHGP